MRPGSLTAQYRDKEKASGPYYQLSYAHEKKNHTNYIRADCVTEVRQQIENYQRFKKLTTEWVALGIEHSKLSMQMKRDPPAKKRDFVIPPILLPSAPRPIPLVPHVQTTDPG